MASECLKYSLFSYGCKNTLSNEKDIEGLKKNYLYFFVHRTTPTMNYNKIEHEKRPKVM